MRWVFGYGSIIWRPSFPYVAARPALIRGWRRRFWQGSPDHRGTPENPGRVVTLVADPHAECHGLAFDTGDHDTPEIIESLDVRESGGYIRIAVDLEFADGTGTTAMTYVAPPENRNFLGPRRSTTSCDRLPGASVRAGTTRNTCSNLPQPCVISKSSTTKSTCSNRVCAAMSTCEAR